MNNYKLYAYGKPFDILKLELKIDNFNLDLDFFKTNYEYGAISREQYEIKIAELLDKMQDTKRQLAKEKLEHFNNINSLYKKGNKNDR